MRGFFTTEGTEENLMKQGLSECELSRSGQRPFTTENTEGTEKKPEEKETEEKKTEEKKTEEKKTEEKKTEEKKTEEKKTEEKKTEEKKTEEKKTEEKKTEEKKTEEKKTEETFSVCSVFSVVNTLFDCHERQEGQPCS